MSEDKDSKQHGIDKYHHFDPSGVDAEQLKSVYADWASLYDDDNDNKLGTVSQPLTAAMLSRHCTDPDTAIMDVGCGTGLVGHFLQQVGFNTYDGTDISPDMMEHARSRGYRNLIPLDVGHPISVDDESYDATVCVGVFTHGHLGPEGFDELLRITRPGGLICFTVNEGVWDVANFPQAIQAHTDAGAWQIVEQIKQDYMVRENVAAWYLTARKSG